MHGNSLRVSLVSETYFPQVNGVSRALDRLVGHLVSQGDRVQLLIPRYREGEPALPPSVCTRSIASFPFPPYPEVSVCLLGPSGVSRALAGFEPHVVHVATEGPLGWSTVSACGRHSVPLVSSYHTQFPQYLKFYRLGWLEPAVWKYLRWFHNRTEATLCPSASIRQELIQRGFERVRVWSRGVEADRFHPGKRDAAVREELGLRPGELALGYVGRLAPEKNLRLLLEAFRDLSRRAAVRLVLVGDGPLRRELEAHAGPGATFTGYRRGEALARVYAALDLFLFPSVTETFGNVLLEAMASGVPVVGFRAPGPIDLIRHGENGLLADAVSAEALCQAALPLLEDGDLRRAMGAAARRWAESQTWEAVNSVVRETYLSAAGPEFGGRSRRRPVRDGDELRVPVT